jgi:hypothetical protein
VKTFLTNALYITVNKSILLSDYIDIILQEVYNCYCVCFIWGETWSVTLREEHRLRVFDSRVLTRIFASKRE